MWLHLRAAAAPPPWVVGWLLALSVVFVALPAVPAAAQSEGEPPSDAESTESEGEDDDYDPRQMRTEGLNDDAGRSAFRVGQTLYEEGRYVQAATEFERAYELSGRASLMFNAYLAHRDAGQLADAVRTLDTYLREHPEVTDAERLSHRLAAMRATLAEQEQSEAERAEREAAAEAERQRLEAEQERLRQEAEDARRRAEEAEAGFSPNPIGIIVGGVGVGALVGALAMGLVANGRVSDLEAQCPGDRCTPALDLVAATDKADRAILATDILLFGGIAVLGTGIALMFIGGDDDEEAPSTQVSGACFSEGCTMSVRGSF